MTRLEALNSAQRREKHMIPHHMSGTSFETYIYIDIVRVSLREFQFAG